MTFHALVMGTRIAVSTAEDTEMMGTASHRLDEEDPTLRVKGVAEKGEFFFQAKDGIRVLYVTGVQTCALPISTPARSCWPRPAVTPTASASISSCERSEPGPPRAREKRRHDSPLDGAAARAHRRSDRGTR